MHDFKAEILQKYVQDEKIRSRDVQFLLSNPVEFTIIHYKQKKYLTRIHFEFGFWNFFLEAIVPFEKENIKPPRPLPPHETNSQSLLQILVA